MCDTLCALAESGSLFGKNSDRPVGEAQVFERFERRPAGGELRTQYLTIPDRGAVALVGSRPTWLWGLEHGVNEHRVAIGNEKLWTLDDPRRAPDALIGMDLVRLGLEQGRTATHAIEVMTELLEDHGQGGVCDQITGDRYFSSFLVADPEEAWVLETMGRRWGARLVRSGGVAISNRFTVHSLHAMGDSVGQDDDLRDWGHPTVSTGHADRRLAVTRALVDPGGAGPLDQGAADPVPTPTPTAFAAVLRDHDDPIARARGELQPIPDPRADADGRGVTVCMHLRHHQVTAGSMIASLPRDPAAPVTTWVALGSPCTSIYVPIRPWVADDDVPRWLSDPAMWSAFDRLRDRAERDPDALSTIRAVLDPLEQRWDGGTDRPPPEPEVADALRSLGALPDDV